MNPANKLFKSSSKNALALFAFSLVGATSSMAQEELFPGASSYGLIVEDTVTITNGIHLHGAGFVGNNLNVANGWSEIGMDLTHNSGAHALHVGNDITGTGSSGIRMFGNDYWHGGALTDANLDNYGLKRDLYGSAASSVFSSLVTFSNTASGFADSGVSLTKDLTNEKEYSLTQGTLNVLNLDSSINSFLSNNNKISFTGLDSDTTLIVNYTPGSSIDINSQFGDLGSLASNVIWNFQGSDTLTFGQNVNFEGGLIATGSDVVWNGTDVDGMVVAENLTWNGNREIHLFDHSAVFAVVPETPTVFLIGFGLFSAFYLKRRKNKVA